MTVARRTNLTPFARRLTPAEVAQHWFRRAPEYAKTMHADYPTFPKAAPDGLYLLADVEAWFDRLHGRQQPPGSRDDRKHLEELIRGAG